MLRGVDPYRARGLTDAELVQASHGLFVVQRGESGLSLRWRWLDRRIVFSLLMCAAGSFMVTRFWLAQASLRANLFAPGTLLFGGTALVGAYLCLAQLLNHTGVVVDESHVSIEYGPLPWPGGKSWPVGEIEQLFVQKEACGRGKSESVHFQLRARTTSGDEEVLVAGLLDAARAQALEATIELYLQIPDQPMTGEHD
jgi:hypothetical protein